MKDRRLIKTKYAIRETFLVLLNEKTIDKITVAELCRRANLGRGTFYLHYTDIYDLYEHVKAEVFDELSSFFDSSMSICDPQNFLKLIEALTYYFASNKTIILLLFASEKNKDNLQKLKGFFMEQLFLENTTYDISYIEFAEILFIVSGFIGILEEWLNNGLTTSPEQLSLILKQLLSKLYYC